MSRLKNLKNALAAALLLVATAAYPATPDPFPAATPESQGLTSQSLGKLLEVVRGYATNGDIVGGELMVIKNRRTVLHEAVGLSDRESKKPLEPDTIYCIRSMTKPMIGAAVQILIDEGRLSLDDTAARYLPSFDNEKSRGITVRQLLTHTGGLPLSTLLGSSFQELASLRAVADRSGMNGPTVPPGSRFQYSDDGADTLGALVAAITGQPAERFIAQRILEPLGMNDTFPLVSAAGGKLARFTSAYSGSRGSWVRFWSPADKPIFPYFLASQGMYSTTSDYARFLALYLDKGRAGGKQVLSEAAVERTLQPAIAMGGPTGFPSLSTQYGQMMADYVDAQKKMVAFGHSGSDGTWAYAWPEHDLMVLYFTQSRFNPTGVELEAAIDRLLLGGTSAAPPSRELTAKAAAPYLGVYWLEQRQRPMIITLENARLALEIPWQGLVELQKSEEPEAWSLAPALNNSVKFQRTGDAPATAFELRRGQSVALQRFKPEAGLPTLDELFKRRPDAQRTEKLAALGTIRMNGSAEFSVGAQKGSFELLSAGNDRSRLKLNIGGGEFQQVIDGNRAWMQQASLPVQEMPEAMARSMKLAGWTLSTGDWRGEFKEASVLKRIELDGQPAYIVLAAPEKGRHRLIYLHADSGLTLGYDEVYALPNMGMVGSEVRFADYRDVEGVQIPFKSTVKYPTPLLGSQAYQIEKIETRLKLDRDPFTLQ
jgi:CubicO group peptidase (beta-lactamase class C family)